MLKKISIVVGLISLILIIYALIPQKQKVSIEYSEEVKILVDNNKNMKIINGFITDSLDIEEGYVITIDNLNMILLLVNEVPPQTHLEDFINDQPRMKDAMYKNINDRYIFVFDKSNPKTLEALDNLNI